MIIIISFILQPFGLKHKHLYNKSKTCAVAPTACALLQQFSLPLGWVPSPILDVGGRIDMEDAMMMVVFMAHAGVKK